PVTQTFGKNPSGRSRAPPLQGDNVHRHIKCENDEQRNDTQVVPYTMQPPRQTTIYASTLTFTKMYANIIIRKKFHTKGEFL
ncbi:MAG: hypothetical protein IKU43_03395, partial [Clostridia bacterium]|nr:hypothetical protein [Clostridia bacterium]